MAIGKMQPLDERIKTIRDEIDAFIDARAAEIKKTCEGVPELVIRNLLTARAEGCQCAAYLEIKAKDAAEEKAA